MKILIIGSEGFIGKSCLLFFQNSGHEIHGCDLQDLMNTDYPYYKISRLTPGFDNIFNKNSFDVCINAAGSGSVPLSITNPSSDFEANTIDTFKILETIRVYNTSCKYVNMSSAAVYGNPQGLPIHEDSRIQPLSPYGWHKFYSELICREFNTLYGIATCSVRPFSVYGPGLKKQLFYDIYKKTLDCTNVLTLFGTGQESRDFIYISDLISCIALIIEKGAIQGEVYNAASGQETTIDVAASTFVKFINPAIQVKFNGEQRIGDPNNWCADISLLKNIGFKSKISLDQGLQNYAEWITK